MKAFVYYYASTALLIGFGIAESQPDEDIPRRALTISEVPAPEDPFLSSGECLKKRFTHLSCQKVFCPPWMRCIEGKCTCKPHYMCHKGAPVCSTNKWVYFSFCQLKALECHQQTSAFSHFGNNCEDDLFETNLREDNVVEVKIPTNSHFLICGESWSIQAANVVCRHKKTQAKGAEAATTLPYSQITNLKGKWPTDCVSTHCTGLESSLAECSSGPPRPLGESSTIATATCYEDIRACSISEFPCVNGKCIDLNSTCDGVNDCGDNSDEMCCRDCKSGFHCRSDVCIPEDAKMDGIVDCLGGEDEVFDGDQRGKDLSPIKREIKTARDKVETLVCGRANDLLPQPNPSWQIRWKRVVGGEEAGRTQFPWQVAIQEDGAINCGGIYISSCWVLTAAHCVRSKPKAYTIKFSLWKKTRVQDTTEIAIVEKVITHSQYNPTTHENDIALLKLEKLPFSEKCIAGNPAIAPVCVPWSLYQFKPGDKCTISGWGQRGNDRTLTLQWATVEIIANCSGIYKSTYFDGMECAGSPDGSVDACQGDSGGPLVCTDASGVAYAWGIISWRDRCGVAGHPGVYTKVAHYYEWISLHIGKSTISRYNV